MSVFTFDSIQTKRPAKPPRMTIYGPAGIGKTTFATSAPAPIVLQTEDGLGVIDVPHFPLAKTYGEAVSAIGVLYSEKHDFQTLVIDSLDWLEPLIWQAVCQKNNVPSIESLGYGKGYVEALGFWREFLDGLTALRDQRGMGIVMIAHAQVVHIEDPTMPAYDAHGLKLHKRAAALVEEYSDIVGFANLKTLTMTEEAGFNQKRTRATTTGERVLFTQNQPAYLAKTRYPLPNPLPLQWAAFQAAFAAANNPPTQTQKETTP